jgi:hypothetical protein
MKIWDTNPFKKKTQPKKPPRPTQRKFAFKLSYSTTTTTKYKDTLHFFGSIYLFTVSDY